MALITLGAFVTAIRGKQKGSVFSQAPAGAVMRNKTTPTKVASQKRSRINNRWKSFTQTWNALTVSERSAWDVFTSHFTFHNKLMQPVAARRNLVFSVVNTFYFEINSTVLIAPILYAPPSATLLPFAAISMGGTSAQLGWSNVLTDVYVNLFISPPFQLGKEQIMKSRIKKLMPLTLVSGGASVLDFTVPFFTKYPWAPVGSYIWVAWRKVEPNCFSWSAFEYLLVQIT